MNVQITFEPEGASGLVAEGTLIWEAAKRLGVSIRIDCRGRGECDSCAVAIDRGAALLSAATAAEERVLGPERLRHPDQVERLACQAVLARRGEITARLPPVREEESSGASTKTIWDLPLKEKVGTLIEVEAIAISGAVNSLRSGYHALVEKFLNLTPQTTNDAKVTTKDTKSGTAGEADQTNNTAPQNVTEGPGDH